jgi:NADPH-dependent curcumin reductase CurA
VIASNNSKYSVGDIVFANTNWETYSIIEGNQIHFPCMKNHPNLIQYLSLCGICTITAWIGLNEIAKAQEGETIVVSAASGATGSAVC